MAFKDYNGVTLDPKKYDVENYTYPDNLFTQVDASQYGNSWVMINVNVQSIGKDARVENNTIHLNEDEANKRNTVQTVNREKRRDRSIEATYKAAGARAGALAVFKELVTGTNSITDAAVNVGQATVFTGGTVYGITTFAGQASRHTKRLKAAIQLPMPNMLLTNYGMNWGTTDTMLYDMMTRGYDYSSIKPGDKFMDNLVGSDMADVAAGALLGISKFMDMGAMSTATGLAANTKIEQIFQGMSHRDFSFVYQLFPKNLKEAQTIRNIIYTLKYHAHPEYKNNSTRMNFIYPSEFDITYFTGDGQENKYVPRVATCILKSLMVNYAPSNVWSSHVDGVPNMITLSLTFSELGILTKESITEGF